MSNKDQTVEVLAVPVFQAVNFLLSDQTKSADDLAANLQLIKDNIEAIALMNDQDKYLKLTKKLIEIGLFNTDGEFSDIAFGILEMLPHNPEVLGQMIGFYDAVNQIRAKNKSGFIKLIELLNTYILLADLRASHEIDKVDMEAFYKGGFAYDVIANRVGTKNFIGETPNLKVEGMDECLNLIESVQSKLFEHSFIIFTALNSSTEPILPSLVIFMTSLKEYFRTDQKAAFESKIVELTRNAKPDKLAFLLDFEKNLGLKL